MPQSTEIIYTEVATVDHGKSGLSWSAIIGGAFVALALSFILAMLGVGFGLTSFSFWPGRTTSATTFGIGAAIWVIVVQWVSAALGGYVAGRTRARWNGLHTHESTFRDTVHGLLAWALFTVAGAFLFVSAAGMLASGGLQAAQAGAQAAGPALAQAANRPGPGSAQAGAAALDPIAPYTDKLFRPEPTAGAQPVTPPATVSPDLRAESGRILLAEMRDGKIADNDKAYLTQLVANATNLSQPDAAKRVDEVTQQVAADATKLRDNAEAARKAAATGAFFTAFSLLIGAFIGGAAGAFGGAQREHSAMRRVV